MFKTSQGWLSVVNNKQDYHKFYMLHASVFRGQEINASNSLNLPFCEMWVINKESDRVHWQQCKSEKPQVLINISRGEIVDWSPFSFPQENILTQNWDSNGIIQMELWKLVLLLMNLFDGMELKSKSRPLFVRLLDWILLWLQELLH